MSARSSRLSIAFSCLGHSYMHLFTAFYFVIALTLEDAWRLEYHELIELWTLGALLVGVAALPAGWLGDRWSAAGMMVVYFLGLGSAGIVCGLVDGPTAMFVGLTALGLAAAIYHPVGIAWLVRNARVRGRALGINGAFGGLGVAGAGLVAGALIDLLGWRAAFIIPGVVCLATGLALLACIRLGLIVETPPAPRSEAAAPSRGVVLRVYGVLLMTMLIMGILFQATQVSVPKVFDLRLRDIAGEGALGIGAIVAAVYAVGSLTQVAGGFMADRFPLRPLYAGCFLLQIPVLAGIAVFGGMPLVTLVAATVFLTTAPLPAENMLLARYTPQRHHSLAYGVKFVLAFGTGPVSILLVSKVQAETGEFYWLYMALAAGALLATLTALLLPSETSHRTAPAVAAE